MKRRYPCTQGGNLDPKPGLPDFSSSGGCEYHVWGLLSSSCHGVNCPRVNLLMTIHTLQDSESAHFS